MTEKWKQIVIVCRDEEASLENLLNYIRSTAGIGHSFSIVVDPIDPEFKRQFFIDGDGADKIRTITSIEVLKP